MEKEENKKRTFNGKDAIRAFLQRSEVRLSTMHRVAGSFLSGAGLLLLFPIFFKDAVLVIAKTLFSLPDKSLLFAFAISTFTSVILPLYSLYLLLKDIVRFYFTSYHPGFPDHICHPRFILSGLSFSEDGCEDEKQELLRAQRKNNLINFVLPQSEREQAQRARLLKTFKDDIIPETRKLAIEEYRKELNKEPSPNNDETKRREEKINNLERFYLEFGLAAVMDRPLEHEAAKMEASLVRHAISLRRLVLRYAKALLLFIWTTLAFLFIASALSAIHPENGKSVDTTVVINAEIYLYTAIFIAILWHSLAYFIVKRPISWIIQHAKSFKKMEYIDDPELHHFEGVVKMVSFLTLIPWFFFFIIKLL